MPKGKGGGKNRRRGKKSSNEEFKRQLITKEEGQEDARVEKMLGNGRLNAYCYDGKTRMCNIRGKMRKKIWIKLGDIILIALREFQDAKADVIHKYAPEEARKLKAMGELPDNAQVVENKDGQIEDDDFNFDFKDI